MNARQSIHSSKNELDTKIRSPERFSKAEDFLSPLRSNSDHNEPSESLSNEKKETPPGSGSKYVAENLTTGVEAGEKVQVKKADVKSNVTRPSPPPSLPDLVPAAVVGAHSEEANDGFDDDSDSRVVKVEGKVQDEIAERAPSSAADPIPIPVSDINSVDLHSMIEMKQKNLKVMSVMPSMLSYVLT